MWIQALLMKTYNCVVWKNKQNLLFIMQNDHFYKAAEQLLKETI